ncbi:MAG: alpha-1,2-fucosyltransferase [Verrucomicrobiaceae bacterium]|nr:MAG: alpha-1,2-fucosyltransferase [Verrucomicrobiaceae bacterium]
MIRAVMLGRLGNNLFQYALGRTLAEKHGVPFIMDGSWFNAEGWSQVRCIRRLPGPAAGKVKVVRRFSLGTRALLKATGKHYWEYRGVPVLKEKERDHTYDPRFTGAPADCVLFGYFQSPLYFRGMEDQLRRELSTDGLGLEKGQKPLADSLREPGSVAIHVRRTDYTGNPNLDLCGMAYYQTAMEKIRLSVKTPAFHVFSDDPAWCATTFRDPDTRIVIHPAPVCALTDLHLMSLASHHIIANSSYSWWAAWLGKKDRQQVLMPPRWFREILAPIGEKQAEGWAIVEA